MKNETNFETSLLNTQEVKAEAAATLTPDATNGDKIKALRTAQHMSMAELARRASMSDRAIRYIESNQREPSVDAIQKIAAALGVTTDYFMDEATFQQELNDDLFYADVRKKYGSRGVAQAKKIKEQTTALFAGGELSKEDQAAFIKEMEVLFLDAKADAKKFTPKKYLRYYCDACHYCFESKSLPDRCPDCGAVMFGEKSAVRPATENEKTELLRIRAEDND